MLGGAREEGPSMDVAFADYLAKADLTAYATINPNSRTISISANKDTDGDGVADIEEIKQGTDPANPKSYPGSNNQPVIPSTGKNAQPTNPSTGKMDQTYIPALVGTNSPNQLASQTKNTFTSAKDDTQIKANNHHLSVTVAKTFTAGSATLPETGTSDSPAIYMIALLTSILAFFGLKKKEESK